MNLDGHHSAFLSAPEGYFFRDCGMIATNLECVITRTRDLRRSGVWKSDI